MVAIDEEPSRSCSSDVVVVAVDAWRAQPARRAGRHAVAVATRRAAMPSSRVGILIRRDCDTLLRRRCLENSM